MRVDIKEKLKDKTMLRELPKNHRAIFEEKLQNELHRKKRTPRVHLLVAASIIVLFSMGILLTMTQESEMLPAEKASTQVSLEEFSPELKKIENYYLTAINFEIANLPVDDANKAILQESFRKMNTLTNEYKLQSEQLEIDKIDEELINNLIDNLQMRLQLMIELKKELKKLKSKENEEQIL